MKALEFSWLIPPGTAAGITLLAVGVLLYAYHHGPEDTPAPLRLAWLAKRLLVLGAILGLTSSPRIVRETRIPLINDIWVVVDQSKSMSIRDQSGSRYAKAKELTALIQRTLSDRYTIRLATIGGGAREGSQLPATAAAGASALGEDLTKLAAEMDERLTRAVVVLSDARVTSGASLDAAAPGLSRLGASVLGITLGKIRRVTDLSIQELETPQTVTQGESFKVTFTVRRSPSSPDTTSATVLIDGKTAQNTAIQFAKDETEKHLTLKARIDKSGFTKVAVRVPPASGEKNLADNEQERLVKVALTKANSLLVWSKPDPSMGAIARFLETERGEAARALMPSRDTAAHYGGGILPVENLRKILGDPNQLKQFDLLVIGDANLNTLHPKALANVEMVNRYYGTGVLWVFGGESSPSYSPALPKPVSLNRAAYTYQPGAALYRLIGKGEPPTLSSWPTLSTVVASSGAKPEETVLWAAGSLAGQVRYPLFSCQSRLGRSCAIYSMGLWRWFLTPSTEQEVPSQAAGVLRGMMEFLTDKAAPRRLMVTLTKNRLVTGESITADIEAMNAAYEPLREGRITVSTHCGNRIIHREVAQNIGRMNYESPPLPAGACHLFTELSGPDGVFSDRKDFLVEAQNLEMASRDADPAAMKALIKAVQGKEVPPENLQKTVAGLEPKPVFQKEIQEVDLGRHPWLLALALSLLALEWFWRRRAGVP